MTSSIHNAPLSLEFTRVAGPLRNAFAFLMLGGGSLVVMALFFLVRQPQVLMRDDVRSMLQELSGSTLFFVVLLSYPHFVWSYRFAYQQGFDFIKRHSARLITYPLVLSGLLFLCAISWGYPISNLPVLVAFENSCRSIGINLNWSLYNGVGQLLFSCLLVLQIVMSGHHYCLQAYGVALSEGEKHGYALTTGQRKLLRINLYSLWAMNLLSGFAFLSVLNSRTFAFHALQLPAAINLTSYAFFALTTVLVLWKILLVNRKVPPFQFAIPILSIWFWLQPFVQPYGFQFLVVPVAHGAQNLFYAYQVEINNFDSSLASIKRKLQPFGLLIVLSLLAMAIGYMSFHTIPVMLDRARLIPGLLPNFFFLSAFILISTHHYVLDGAVWKRDSRARQVLQGITERE